MELRSAKEIMESIAGDCDNPRGPRAQQTMVPSGEKTQTLTDNEGHPVGDIMHSLNIAGHPVTSDVLLMEKQQTFNRSKTVERMVHPCGSGAFGYFETTTDMSQYTKAKLFNGVGKRTPVFVRFSTVTYGKEFPDSARNPRGFAIKFYTEEGNYDLVGLNFPVFFVRDPALGPDVIRSQQRNPQNFLLNFDSMNDFMAMVPESLHCGLMFFSDHGTPYGWRHMHGYGAHTFKWVNEAGEAFYIKYTFRTDAGVRNFTYPEAVRMCGEDPDFAKRDLYEHIRSGKEATWRAYVQIMPAADALTYRFDPFDVTKVWPRADYPLHEFGRLVLNRNPDNFHRDVEQAAFSPGSLVPGIEPSPDLLLQFRMFLYRDTQYYRLGTNLHQIPVNFPFRAQNLCPFSRDGTMRMDTNGQSQAHYMPNSYAGAKPDTRYNWQPVAISGELDRRAASRHEARLEDDLIQARELYSRVMDDGARRNTAFNIAATLKFCQPEIVRRSLIQWYKVHPNLATDIARDLGYVDIGEIEKSAQTQPAMVDRGNAYNLVTP